MLWVGAVATVVLIGSGLIIGAAATPVSSAAGLLDVIRLGATGVGAPVATAFGGLIGDFCCG